VAWGKLPGRIYISKSELVAQPSFPVVTIYVLMVANIECQYASGKAVEGLWSD
jgi:hypothetical protein